MSLERFVLALCAAAALGAMLPYPALFAALHGAWIVGGLHVARRMERVAEHR